LLQAEAMAGVATRQLFHDFFYQHLLHWIEVISLLDYNLVFSLLERAAEWAYVWIFFHSDTIDRSFSATDQICG
jgi:hypothetical protein